MRSIVSDGTNLYIASQNGLRKIVVSTGVDTTMTTEKTFNSLTFGNSHLYGSDQDGIFTINTGDGTVASVTDLEGIEAIMYYSTTQLLALLKNTAVVVTIATGEQTYITGATDL